MNIKMDQLTYLPIKEGRVFWDLSNGHNYDVLMVVDDLGKVWSVPYFCGHSAGPMYGEYFENWVEWLTTGVKPAWNKQLYKHQEAYEITTAVGLANKCIQYPEYGKALLEVIEKSYEQASNDGKISQEKKDSFIQEVRETFEEAFTCNMLIESEVNEQMRKLCDIIDVARPYEFLGIYHLDGDIKYERKDYVAGKSLSKIPIPKSAYELDDAKLAESDFPGIFHELNCSEHFDKKWYELDVIIGEDWGYAWQIYTDVGVFARGDELQVVLEDGTLTKFFANSIAQHICKCLNDACEITRRFYGEAIRKIKESHVYDDYKEEIDAALEKIANDEQNPIDERVLAEILHDHTMVTYHGAYDFDEDFNADDLGCRIVLGR